jgi:AbrB family looped-hinge helix DNA binding protein
VEVSKITARGQTTIPKRVRDAIGLNDSDVISFEVEDDHLIVRKVTTAQDDYLQGLSATLSEWASPEDEDAWRDL